MPPANNSTPTKLTIGHLRGSVSPFTLQFEKGKKLTIIYGENGTGKSTICDALEFIGKGKVGSLENRGLGRTAQYWHSLGKTAADIAVSFETTSGSCRATVGKNDVVVDPPQLRPQVEVLRRSQILSLIEANPADRYTEISRFIDVAPVEASEKALRDAVRDAEKALDTATTRIVENQTGINQYWESAGKPDGDPLVWARKECARDATIFDAEITALSAVSAAFARLSPYPPKLQDAESKLKAAVDQAAQAQKDVDGCLATISADAEETVGVLEAAGKFLAKNAAPAVCPLCESSEKIADLANRVNSRLQKFSALRTAKAKKHAADQLCLKLSPQLESLKASAKKEADDFETVRQKNPIPKDIPIPSSPAPENHPELAAWLATNAGLPAEWKTAETARLDKKQFFGALKKALQTLTDNNQAQQQLGIILPAMKKVLQVVEEERRKFIDTTLLSIAAEVDRLYTSVHPGEGVTDIRLALDPARRASLAIEASFGGKTGVPPQAYFSDSHLDTLGLCVFFALAAREKPEEMFLVLDDVLASIDEPHVERLIEMIYSESLKFRHCLITTHYRPWKEKLRWGWLKHGQCQFVELSKWSLQQGLILTRSTPDIERLRALLAETPPDPQLVCAKAGVILEAILDFLTLLYECSVPRRPNGLYTLGDLLPAVRGEKKLKQALKVDVHKGFDASGLPIYDSVLLGSFFDELHRIAQARNVFGCHFNNIAFTLLDSDAIGFGKQVLDLASVVVDEQIGWPRSNKSGSYWATAGETRRLHPLQKPS